MTAAQLNRAQGCALTHVVAFYFPFVDAVGLAHVTDHWTKYLCECAPRTVPEYAQGVTLRGWGGTQAHRQRSPYRRPGRIRKGRR